MRRIVLPAVLVLLATRTIWSQLPATTPGSSPATTPVSTPSGAPSGAPSSVGSVGSDSGGSGGGAAPAAAPTVPTVPTVPIVPAAPGASSVAGGSGGGAGKISYSSCRVEGPYVAMTFDDGPHAQLTPRLLDLLKERKIRATFFVVGQNAAEYPEVLKRIVAEGHELANHSYTHPILASMGEAALMEQMEKTHQAVLRATGVTMKVMRPPYGALSEPQRRLVHARYGYRVILWDVDPLDWKIRDAERVSREILARTQAGSIVLSHDIHKSTVDAMPATLDGLQAKGFQFVTVSELLAMDQPGAGKGGSAAAGAAGAAAVAGKESGVEKKAGGSRKSKESKDGEAEEKGGKAEKPEKAQGAAKKPETQEEVRQKWLKLFGR